MAVHEKLIEKLQRERQELLDVSRAEEDRAVQEERGLNRRIGEATLRYETLSKRTEQLDGVQSELTELSDLLEAVRSRCGETSREWESKWAVERFFSWSSHVASLHSELGRIPQTRVAETEDGVWTWTHGQKTVAFSALKESKN